MGVKNAMLKALHEVVSKAGANMGEQSRTAILGLIDGDTRDETDAMSITNARLLGALIQNLPAASASTLMKNRVLTSHFTNASVLALNAVLLESAATITESFPHETPTIMCQGIAGQNVRLAVRCDIANCKLTTLPFSPS